jgi:MFS family permease
VARWPTILGRKAGGSTLFTPAFIALSVAEFAYFTAEGLTIPVTPLFADGPIGADEAGVGVAVGAFAVTALILRPIAGRWADRRGRRPLFVGGALLYAAAMAAHVLATTLPMLIALRLVLGAAEAFFFVAGLALLADLAPPGRTGEALSFNSLSLYLGIALGPLLGELLLELGGFHAAWIGGSALAVLAAIIALRIPEPPRPAAPVDRPTPLFHRAAIGPGLGLFTGIAAMGGFFAFVAIYARDLGMDGARTVLLMFGLIVIVTRLVFATLPDRVPPFRLATASLGLCGIGLAIVAASGTVEGLFAGGAVLAVGVAFTTPSFFAAIFGRVPAEERGAAAGTASLFLDLAFGIGPMVLGVVAATAGIGGAYALAAVVATIGALGTGVVAFRPGRADRAPSGSEG